MDRQNAETPSEDGHQAMAHRCDLTELIMCTEPPARYSLLIPQRYRRTVRPDIHSRRSAIMDSGLAAESVVG
jgi:hypothetical protein